MRTWTISAGVLVASIAIAGCQDHRITTPDAAERPGGSALARVLQPGQVEAPCGSVVTIALRDAAGAEVGQAEVWNGETTAYVRLTAQQGWEFTEVRVGGARRAERFPHTGGMVDPSRFPFGGSVSPAQGEVVIEALHLDNPYGVQQGDEVLLAAFARLQPAGGGASVSAWAEGPRFQPGQHPMYMRYTLQECAPPPPPPLDPSTVTAGGHHSCGLTRSGTAYCWGLNDRGQLGDGTTISRRAPVALDTELRFATLSAGRQHTCGLTGAGTAYCWGLNDAGQLGDGTTTNRTTAAAVAGGHRFAAITTHGDHTCALTEDGSAYCWGWNAWGAVGDGTNLNHRTMPTTVAGSHQFRAITGGSNHTCGLRLDATAFCWGRNVNGQLGDGTTTNRFVPTPVTTDLRFASISAAAGPGGEHTCALTADGSGYCWGNNQHGQLGDGTTTHRLLPMAVDTDLRFASISAGAIHTCGRTSGNIAYCWGRGIWGQLGNGTSAEQHLPTAVAGGYRFSILSAGWQHTCALTEERVAYCWGFNGDGQLGDGTNELRRLTPASVFGWGDLANLPFIGRALYALVADFTSSPRWAAS